MTTVFISWSGAISREIAEELRNWIPSVLQFAKPYYTPNDIEKGTKWGSEITQKLSEANVGIVCLTKDNVEKPWILFEAGALSKDLEKSKVCSILFGLENTDISGPLATFQATEFRKIDFKKMMASINEYGGEAKLPIETFNRVFDKWWPEIETNIGKILSREREDKSEIRSDRDLLEEILVLSRNSIRNSMKARGKIDAAPILIDDILHSIEGIVDENGILENEKIQLCLGRTLDLIEVLANNSTDNPSIRARFLDLHERNAKFMPF